MCENVCVYVCVCMGVHVCVCESASVSEGVVAESRRRNKYLIGG